jgi:hypothetical protein
MLCGVQAALGGKDCWLTYTLSVVSVENYAIIYFLFQLSI